MKSESWIPVSERLPDKTVLYLVTLRNIGWNGQEIGTRRMTLLNYYTCDKKWEWYYQEEVAAWMPAPEIWKGDLCC